MFTVSRIYFTLIYTIGLQYQATWRALCLGLRIRHVSRGEGESFVPQNPFNSQGPCSLVVVLRPEMPPVFETRVSPLFEVRVPPVLIEACCLLSKAHVPLVFEVLVPPLRVFLFATQELISSNSNTYVFLY